METKFLHNTHINPFLSLPSSSPSPSSLSTPPPLHFNFRRGNVEVQPLSCPRKAGCTQTLRSPIPVKGRSQVGPTHIQRRRALLLMGLSIFPFYTLTSDNAAFQVLASSSSGNEHDSEKEDPHQEVTSVELEPSNPVTSLLNSIGIIGSGVLASLYSIARKDKMRSDAMIESLISEVEEKDTTIGSLKINFDAKMLQLQEQQSKLLSKVKEEKSSLLNRIESANVTITALGRDLQVAKRKIKESRGQIENLETKLGEAKRYKQTLEDEMKDKDSSITILQENINKLSSEVSEKEITVKSLSSAIARKDSDLENSNSVYMRTKNELDSVTSEIVNLKDELLKSRSELGRRNSVVDDLSDRVDSLMNERDGLTAQLDDLEQLYSDLESSSEEKVASDSKLLEEMEVELGQLRSKYEVAVTEAWEMQSVMSDLNRERVDLKKMVDYDTDYAKTLKQELESIEVDLGLSRDEVSDLSKRLDESKRSCIELEGALSKARAVFHHTSEFLEKSVKAGLKTSGGLADELKSVKGELDEAKNELRMVSSELATMTNDRNALQNDLVEASSEIRAAGMVYKEEKERVGSLKKELEALKEQISEDLEVKKSLEANLKEVAEFVDDMDKNFGALSRDFEAADTRVSSLGKERDDLRKALEKEKRVTKEARDNLETAHSVVMRLGNDRERLEKRAEELEEDLAFAKGEILRLKDVRSSKIVDSTKECGHIPSEEGERADVDKPKEETESAIISENEEVEVETESTIMSENEEGGEFAVMGNPKEETECGSRSETEEEVKRSVTATSGTTLMRGGRKRKASSQ